MTVALFPVLNSASGKTDAQGPQENRATDIASAPKQGPILCNYVTDIYLFFLNMNLFDF